METAIPQQTLKSIGEVINPEIERIETEDEKIAQLFNQPGWIALKERIKRKQAIITENAKVTSDTLHLIDDVQVFGFRCMSKDLLLEAYQSVIDDVELTYKFLKEQKDEQRGQITEVEQGGAE